MLGLEKSTSQLGRNGPLTCRKVAIWTSKQELVAFLDLCGEIARGGLLSSSALSLGLFHVRGGSRRKAYQ